MSRDLGRDVPDLKKNIYARKLWVDFSFPMWGGGGGKHGPIWQNCVSNQVVQGFLTLYLIKTL